MNDLLKKKPTSQQTQMETQADLIAAASVREFRAAALGIGWALALGLFFGFLAIGFVLSMCAGFGWLVWIWL